MSDGAGCGEFRKRWNDAFKEVPKTPLNIDIELTKICNARCPFCFYSSNTWNASQLDTARIMPTEMALSIIDQAAKIGVPALKFNWRGESTLHPDYSEIILTAKHTLKCDYDGHPGNLNDCDGRFWGGLLVNTNANCDAKAISGLMAATKVAISLDSTREETYKKMRRGLSLEKAFNTIRTLIRNNHPNLWIRRVVTDDNRHEDFKADVDEIFGGKGYKVSEHYAFERSGGKEDTGSYERTFCGYPNQRLVISTDGDVYPCCVDTAGTMPLGNIKRQSLLEIWNGEKLQSIRAELMANRMPSDTCKNCESWMAYKAPQRDYVQDKAK